MDAKEFLREWGRMCKQHDICKGCTADDASCSKYTRTAPDAKLVDIVEKWAKEHPVKINRDALKEKFGTITFDTDHFYTLDHFYVNAMSVNDWLNSEYKEPEEEND